MTDEAEKVINLSLCKMAESRTIRRGGNSLHKHLLIASVLTKARSAYFENWYLGDNDCSSVSSSSYSSQQQSYPNSPQSVNRRGANGISCSNSFSDPSSSSQLEQQQSVPANDQQIAINNNHIIDPRFFVEVESEIELPSDILNCVEKLGDMGDMGFMSHSQHDSNSLHHHNNHVNRNASASGIIHEVDEIFEESDPTAEMILSDVVVSIDEDIDVTDPSPDDHYTSPCSPDNSRSTLTYLDLDARPPTPNKSSDSSSSSFYSSSSSALISSASNAVVIQPIILPGPNNSCLPSGNSNNNNNNSSNSSSSDSNSNSISIITSTKRRRGWSFEDDDDLLYTDDELAQQLPDELNEKLKKNGVSVTNMAKRLRFSGDCSSSSSSSSSSSNSSSSSSGFRSGSDGDKSPTNESRNEDEHEREVVASTPATFAFKRSSFRTKKSHFEELDEEDDVCEDSDDDSFLADDLGQTSWCDGKNDDSSHKNDRRVPSASSSGSCSDEDADSNSMEVDQLTSLVQYISFKHQQQQQQQQQQQHSQQASSGTNNGSGSGGIADKLGACLSGNGMSSGGGNGGGLIRSMSSPDLCTRVAAVSSSVSQVNKSNAKDLFSSYNNGHRVLTMTV